MAVGLLNRMTYREKSTMQQADTPIVRSPFGTMDVPEPNDEEVTTYAATAMLSGGADDANAAQWRLETSMSPNPLDGAWLSRWNGGADPTIAGDRREKWKQGRAEVRSVGDRVYLRFEWDSGRRHGLINARREGPNRLVGKYINLSNPKITRPWVGLIVDTTRIDGCHPNGRLDFRR
jgi:hypothetical protein